MRAEKMGTEICTVRVLITGRVQGVGYRAWVEWRATALGLHGWVRNRRDGAVEALFSGACGAVENMLEQCRAGPSLARVRDVTAVEEGGTAPIGFKVLPIA